MDKSSWTYRSKAFFIKKITQWPLDIYMPNKKLTSQYKIYVHLFPII